MEKRFYYKDKNGNKYSFKSEHKDLTTITECEFYKNPQISEELKVKFEKQEKIAILTKEINHLKNQLAQSDYKVLKYIEGKLTNLEFAQVSTERQKIRDEINALEKEVEKYE